jgi:aspartate/tyrosine/aromatic aminotransferase
MENIQKILDDYKLVLRITKAKDGDHEAFNIEIRYHQDAEDEFNELREHLMDVVSAHRVQKQWEENKLPDDGMFVLIGNTYREIDAMSKEFKINLRTPNYEI